MSKYLKMFLEDNNIEEGEEFQIIDLDGSLKFNGHWFYFEDGFYSQKLSLQKIIV